MRTLSQYVNDLNFSLSTFQFFGVLMKVLFENT